MEPGRGHARHLGRRRHRDSLAGAEVAPDREDRRAAQREEAAAGRRHQGRVRRRRPHRDRAEVAHVDPALMMESLFRLTELESKISLNLNVLIKGRIPKVVGLAECLREWLDHLRDVLLRRTNYRKAQIENRLEVLGGF